MLFIVWQYLQAVGFRPEADGQTHGVYTGFLNSISQQMHGGCSEHYRKFISYPIIMFKNNQHSLVSVPVMWKDMTFLDNVHLRKMPEALQNFIFSLKLLK